MLEAGEEGRLTQVWMMQNQSARLSAGA